MTHVRGAVAALALLSLACAAKPPSDMPAPPADPIPACDGSAPDGEVTIQYLRAGGVAIVYGDEALLTAPFYSNPSFAWVSLSLPIAPDPERIPNRPDLLDGKTVDGMLVGHAHYDHLMDVPSVLVKWQMQDVPVFGDSTAVNQLGNVGWRGQAYAVDASGGSRKEAGDWMYPPAAPGRHPEGSRFRVMALKSEHAPHWYFGVKFYQGHIAANGDKPRYPGDWKEGQTWAYLIDVLADDGERVLLRIHYQDSASTPKLGWPPKTLLAARPVDLALFCAASFDKVTGYPERILRKLAPRHAMAIHWDDFFSDPGEDTRVVRFTDLSDLLDKFEDPELGPLPPVSVPLPGEKIRFSVCPAGSPRSG